MKDTHMYMRLSNYSSFRSLLNVINTENMDVVEQVYENITTHANDHPKYVAIKDAYDKRKGNITIG